MTEAHRAERELARAERSLALQTAQAWRMRPIMRPNMNTCAIGISRIAITSSRLVNPLGFSNGTAELEL